MYNNVKRLSELDSEGLTLDEVSRQFPETLREGASGPGVQLLQYFLAIAGEYYDALPRWQPAEIDGIFGPQTRAAVSAYQRMLGLPDTGEADREDMGRARLDLSVHPCGAAGAGMAGSGGRLPGGLRGRGHARRSGARGAGADQRHRARLAAGARGRVDGIFGPATRDAVSVVQALLGLPASGAIGPLTWEGMAQLARDVLASSQTGETLR